VGGKKALKEAENKESALAGNRGHAFEIRLFDEADICKPSGGSNREETEVKKIRGLKGSVHIRRLVLDRFQAIQKKKKQASPHISRPKENSGMHKKGKAISIEKD